MRIAFVAAGAAGMYCGSCIHDNTLAAALQRLGHEVALIPTYTPIRTDEHEVAIDRVFFGAVNVYLQQKVPLFRHTPEVFDRLLDRPALLSWVSRFSSSTDARDLGALTLSMLQGEHGKQSKELEKLLDFLVDFEPDLVQLTNSMFLGMTHRIKERLGVPVVCGLTGEDLFLDDLVQPFYDQVRSEIARRAREADGFIAMSRWYADFMADYLSIERDKIHVIPLGINLDDVRGREDDGPAPPAQGSTTVGYLGRICPEKGVHLLVEAFRLLAASGSAPTAKLKIAGYVGARDEAYIARIEEQVESGELAGRVEILGELDREAKLSFLRGLDLFSMPTVYKEPKGLPVLEAMAHGVPVVQPRHGTFPELIEATGGGVLVEPESPPALAEAIAGLLADDERRRALGATGRKSVHHHFDAETMATKTLELYRHLASRPTETLEATP